MKTFPVVRTFACASVLTFAAVSSAVAQETRESELAALRADKATRLHEYEPSALERRTAMVMNLLNVERPVYTFIGSAFDGGGIAVGPGYRGHFADSGAFDVHAAWSLRNYKVADAQLQLPQLAHGRLSIQANGHWLDAPSVAFYGLGNDSSANRADLSYRTHTVGATARVHAARFVAVGGGMDMVAIEATDASPTYRRSRAFAEVDWRTSPSYTRRGGLYRIDWSDNHDSKSGGTHGFQRVDAELNQFLPILRENWVIALRAVASTTSSSAGQSIPYVLLPDLGGSHTLRGYPIWRFRDRSRVLFSGEYRWTTSPFMDMALFVDAGHVAPRLADVDLRDLKKSYGIGASFHTPNRTVTRIELARTAEGLGLSFSFSPSF